MEGHLKAGDIWWKEVKMNPGDRAMLINGDVLGQIGLGSSIGWSVTLERILSLDERAKNAYCTLHPNEVMWWVKKIPQTGGFDYYVPECCLQLMSSGATTQPAAAPHAAAKKKDKDMLFAITILKVDKDGNETIVVSTQ